MCMGCWIEMCGLLPGIDPELDSVAEGDVLWAAVTPEMRTLVEAIATFRLIPSCETGGPIHCEIDDDNLDDEDIDRTLAGGFEAWKAWHQDRSRTPMPPPG